jgi:hypothetical protein
LQIAAIFAKMERMTINFWFVTNATSIFAISTVVASQLFLMMIGFAETVLWNVKKR